jgi:hypothetical protein
LSEQIFRIGGRFCRGQAAKRRAGGHKLGQAALIEARFVKILTKTGPLTVAKAVTLQVTPEQAQKVVLAGNIGKFSLVLR